MVHLQYILSCPVCGWCFIQYCFRLTYYEPSHHSIVTLPQTGVPWSATMRLRCPNLRNAIQADFKMLWNALVEARDELQNAIDTRDVS